ncbi:hypothetical protein AKJ16_DCAP23503, partial [Drosera capensis]
SCVQSPNPKKKQRKEKKKTKKKNLKSTDSHNTIAPPPTKPLSNLTCSLKSPNQIQILGFPTMINLLYTIILSQSLTILLLLFKSPLRKLVILGLDRLKRGRGPVVVKTIAATVLVVFVSTVYGIVDVMNREVEPGMINPTDQVLLARNMLDASLMGFILFLGLMIDRLHHYIRELRLLRKAMEAAKKQSR